MTALRLTGLNIRLPVPEGTLHAVRGVDLEIAPCELLCLVGESGSGKSLTALAAMGLLPRSARIAADDLTIAGQDMRRATEPAWRDLRGNRAAMIFQDPTTSLDPVWTIGEQMIEGPRTHDPTLSRSAALARAEALLARTGIDHPAMRLRQYPHQLSGGQRQRAMIAAALMTSPTLLIADEPTTALDATIQAQILALIATLKRDLDLAVLLITHDLATAAVHADRVAVMYAGQIVETAPASTIFANPRHPYTAALLACRPGDTRGAGIPGTVPTLAPPPAGCAFRARCTHAIAACTTEPPFRAIAPAHHLRCHLTDAPMPSHVASVPSARPPAPGIAAAMALQNVSVRFTTRSLFRSVHATQALDDISLTIPRGATLGIVGESGSGKSTLARVLLGLQPPDSGRVTLDNQPLAAIPRTARARLIQPVFQDPYASLNPRRRIADIIRQPLDIHAIGSPSTRTQAVRDIMASCGLPERLADARPAQLSGGQRQRVAIATALILRPAIVVGDEPTSALDVSVQAQILALLAQLKTEFGLTYIFISHDLAVVRGLADTLAVMRAGRIVEHGPAAAIFAAPRHDYTRTLLAAANLEPT